MPAAAGAGVAAAGFAVRTLHAPKEGNTEEQYEDAFRCGVSGEDARLTVTVADGASSAVFARQWAQLLVDAFHESPALGAADGELREAVARLGDAWREEVTGRAKSWYAQEKLPQGSSAALLVAQWEPARGTLRAMAVGDACLFVVRNDRLRFGFPVTRAHAFGDRPPLLSTEARGEAPPFLRFETPFQAGDRFLLMTDALAAWFLGTFEARRKPWNGLPQDEEAFAAWLKQRRDAGEIKNDDVTLVEVVAAAD